MLVGDRIKLIREGIDEHVNSEDVTTLQTALKSVLVELEQMVGDLYEADRRYKREVANAIDAERRFPHTS